MKVLALARPLTIQSFQDGGAYALPSFSLEQTNLFLKIGCVDEIFIKIPSERGLGDYRRFIKLAEPTDADVRPLEDLERFNHLEETLARFPGLHNLMGIGAEAAHYLAVHKIQYERLRAEPAMWVPEARFGVLRSRRFFGSLAPAMFQERVGGTTLWAMFDFDTLHVKREWRPFLPTISAQLSALLDSPLLNHVDWNIKNFVFNESTSRLCYVDLKPTTFVARQSNEHNLKGIRAYFVA